MAFQSIQSTKATSTINIKILASGPCAIFSRTTDYSYPKNTGSSPLYVNSKRGNEKFTPLDAKTICHSKSDEREIFTTEKNKQKQLTVQAAVQE